MVSDGTEARVGTLTAGREWFKPWRTVSGQTLADPYALPSSRLCFKASLRPATASSL